MFLTNSFNASHPQDFSDQSSPIFMPIEQDQYLQRSSTGKSVKVLQNLLNYRGANLKVDGVFGSITKARVMEFQWANQSIVNGIVCSKTWQQLRAGIVIPTEEKLANLRTQPYSDAAIIQNLKSGERVLMIDRSILLNDQYSWFYVKTKQNVGWIREDFISLSTSLTMPIPTINGMTMKVLTMPWRMSISPSIDLSLHKILDLKNSEKLRFRYMFQFLDPHGPKPMDRILVYVFKTPIANIVDINHSLLLVMQKTQNGYEIISYIPNFQQPVIVVNQMNSGYPDLIIYNEKEGGYPSYHRLCFNGKNYPTILTLDTEISVQSEISGVAFSSRITSELLAPLILI